MNIEILRNLGKAEHFSQNHIVFLEGDAGTHLYIVLKGTFGVYINSFADFPMRVAEIGAGSFFGEMAVIDQAPRSATIIAEADAVAISIDRGHLPELFEKSPEIASGILESLRSRGLATARLLRHSGREAPEIPPPRQTASFRDVGSSMLFFTALSQKIREMNRLLYAEDTTEEPVPVREAAPPEVKKLLPEGYVPLHQADDLDHRDKLRLIDAICPYCGQQSQAYIPLFSMLNFSRQDMDGRVVYSNMDILYYTNIVCPHCNYTDTYLHFTNQKYPAERPGHNGNCFPNEENFTGYARKQNHTFHEAVVSYYQNLNCLEKVTRDPLRFAKAWIRLYWLFSDRKNTELAREAAEQVRFYYARYLNEFVGYIPDEHRMRVYAVLGEMSAALQEYGRALWYYEQSLEIGTKSKSNHLPRYRARYQELKRTYI